MRSYGMTCDAILLALETLSIAVKRAQVCPFNHSEIEINSWQPVTGKQCVAYMQRKTTTKAKICSRTLWPIVY